MGQEQELEEELRQLKRQYSQLNQKWQRDKEAYQNLCTWYATSLRYRLGGLLIDTCKKPMRFFLLPFRIYKLFIEYKGRSLSTDIESVTSTNDNFLEKSPEFDFGTMEYSVNAVKEQGVTIIIPIYNAYEDVRKCLESVLYHREKWHKLLLINDCSTDRKIEQLLAQYQNQEGIRIITNPENLGYVRSINIGIKACDTDVVLLNSDTIVTKNWLNKMILAVCSDNKIMTATPLSNAAGVFSVPCPNVDNKLPAGSNVEDIAQVVEKKSELSFERVPTGNGFCMYIKREAFKHIGLMDEVTFGQGYCEENDFCMRLLQKGFENIICDNVYIYHRHTASFQQKKTQLLKNNKSILLSRYPYYDYLVKRMMESETLSRIRQHVKEGIIEFEENHVVRKNILYVIQCASGGSVKTNEDLMGYIESQDWNVYLLNSDCNTLRLYKFFDGVLLLLRQWEPTNHWDINSIHDAEWRNIYFNILFNYQIDLVHIRHLYKHTFDIVEVAKWLKIPQVLSFHDFYYICPTINLINGEGKFCNNDCTYVSGKCKITESKIKIQEPLQDWVNKVWRKKIATVLPQVDAYITTSQYSKKLYESVYSELKEHIQICEHGRDFNYSRKYYGSFPECEKKIRILIAGNIDYSKGAHYISQLLQLDKEKRLEFHCIGSMTDELEGKVIYYGKYIREDFKDYIDRIKPSFVGIFSVWPETYCHVLTEAFSCGIPCIVSDIGTLRERALKGGCILADLRNPAKAYEEICTISASINKYTILVQGALAQKLRTISDMGNDYLKLYEQLTRSIKKINA